MNNPSASDEALGPDGAAGDGTAHRPCLNQSPRLLPGIYGCISLWQPWVAAVLYHGKRIENRGWALPQSKIGEVTLIHAALNKSEVQRALRIIHDAHGITIDPDVLRFSAVLGAAQFTGSHYSPVYSFCGWGVPNRFHWQIGGCWRLASPFDSKGRQGFFNVQIDRTMDLIAC